MILLQNEEPKVDALINGRPRALQYMDTVAAIGTCSMHGGSRLPWHSRSGSCQNCSINDKAIMRI